MRLTTKGRFAVTAMIDVALRGRTGPVNLSSISQRQRISLSHLEQLFAKLRRHQLVESTRGPGGGYSLGRKPAEITVAEIVLAIDGDTDAEARPFPEEVPGAVKRCTTDELWALASRRALEFLDSVTLQSLVDEQIARGVLLERERPLRAAVPATSRPAPRVNAPNSVFALGAMLAKRS